MSYDEQIERQAHPENFEPVEAETKEYEANPAFASKAERDLFNVEQLKQSLLSDLRNLESIIGREATKDFIINEWLNLTL